MSLVPQIMEVGSCGLHVVHGAFKAGVKATGWELEKILKAMWKLCGNYSMTRLPGRISTLS